MRGSLAVKIHSFSLEQAIQGYSTLEKSNLYCPGKQKRDAFHSGKQHDTLERYQIQKIQTPCNHIFHKLSYHIIPLKQTRQSSLSLRSPRLSPRLYAHSLPNIRRQGQNPNTAKQAVRRYQVEKPFLTSESAYLSIYHDRQTDPPMPKTGMS